MGDEESELVMQAVEGDRTAIQRLLVRCHEQAVAIAQERIPVSLHGALSAQDVCQEAYVSVYQHMGTFRGRSGPAFRSWLGAIVERKLVDLIRAHRCQKRGGDRQAGKQLDPGASSMVELLDLVAVHARTPSRSVARRELADGVRGALERLSPDYQTALRLHYLAGLSVADTAGQMGRSPGSVLMLCNRALRRLAEEIGDPTRFLSHGA